LIDIWYVLFLIFGGGAYVELSAMVQCCPSQKWNPYRPPARHVQRMPVSVYGFPQVRYFHLSPTPPGRDSVLGRPGLSVDWSLGFSHMAIYQWIHALGKEVAQIKRPSAQIVELDELHSSVGHKKTIAGAGLLLIDLGNAYSMLSLAPEGA